MRYTVKDNRVYLGWQSGFRDINGSGETQIANADVDFLLNMESLDVSETKPKMERVQKRFVNNPTRKISYTYDSEYKSGSGTLTGDFKRMHVVDATLGGTTVTDQSTYDAVEIVGGDRSQFFIHFEHGDNRFKDIIGCTANELSIKFSEGEFVTYDMSYMTAKMYEGVYLSGDFSDKEALDLPPFHWKHVLVSLSLDSSHSIYTIPSVRNEVESGSITISNKVDYKYSGNNEYATYYIEKGLTATAEITFYPEDAALWYFAPSESEYRLYGGTKGTLHYDGATGSFNAGDSIVGGISGATADVISVFESSSTEGYLFIINKTGTFEAGEDIDISGGASNVAYVYNAEIEFGLNVTLTNASGLTVVGSPYYITVNGVEYSISLTATETYNDVIGKLNTALAGAGMGCVAAGTSDIKIVASNGGPESITVGEGQTGYPTSDVLSNLTGFTAMEDPSDGFNGGNIHLEVTMERDTDDYVSFFMKDLVIQSISESFEKIDSGVDPVTVKFEIAQVLSDLYVSGSDPLHDNSFSNTY